MCWLYKEDFDRQFRFGPRYFVNLKPHHIAQWMNKITYGTERPTERDLPKFQRANSLFYAKKAISFYMPHGSAAWNPLADSGNPTKSKEVIQLIARVKGFECKKLGRKSCTTRPFILPEYRCINQQLCASKDLTEQYCYPTMFKHQFHFITRADDCTNFLMDDMKTHPEFDYALEQTVR